MSRAAEWGLASLWLGSVIFLAAPIVMVLATLVWAHADNSAQVVLLHAWLARLGVSIAIFSSFIALAFGIKGVRIARHGGENCGLAIGGVAMSVLCLAVWLIAAVVLLNTTESLYFMYG